jgi:hypothetical protein
VLQLPAHAAFVADEPVQARRSHVGGADALLAVLDLGDLRAGTVEVLRHVDDVQVRDKTQIAKMDAELDLRDDRVRGSTSLHCCLSRERLGSNMPCATREPRSSSATTTGPS